MKRFLLWWALLTKRLFRRPGYLAVLLAVPLLTLLLALSARQESGLVTVTLWCEDPTDPVSAAAVERLLAEPGALRCLLSDSEAQARDAVQIGKADAAWLFHRNTSDIIAQFDALGPAAVTVVEREDTVFLMLAREKLAAALYPALSYSVFERFIRELAPDADLTAETLRDYYRTVEVEEPILLFSYVDGGEPQTGSYLTAPVRGLLALLVLLGGLASGMYSFREERCESFVWLPGSQRRLLPVLCHLTAIVPVAAASLAALCVAELLNTAGQELPALLLFCLSAALFCELLRLICPGEGVFCAVIPLLLISSLLLCPVFLDLNRLRPLQLLLPPYYYLKAVFQPRWLLRQLGYTALLAVLVPLAVRLRR